MNNQINFYKKIIYPYISGIAQTCSYCDQIEPLILLKGKYTYITLAIGQYVEGYVQICAKKHRTAATGLYPYETIELEQMKKIVRQTYKEVYNVSGIAFEHGKAGACLWKEKTYENMKSLCHHCHIHFVPVKIDIRDQIKRYLPEELVVNNLSELKQVRENILEAEPYLYFEDSQETGYVYPVEGRSIPRQFLRTCVAEKLGIAEKGDWITYPGVELFESTKQKIKPVLERLYQQINSY